MRKILTAISSFPLVLALTPVAYAATGPQKVEVCPRDSNFRQLCELATGGVGSIIQQLVVLLFIIAVVIALFYLIWGGIKWILSGGDKAGVEAARGTIIAAVLGLIVTFASFFILNIILKFFGVDLFGLTIPSLGV